MITLYRLPLHLELCSSILDRLPCQFYYNQYLSAIIHELVSSGLQPEDFAGSGEVTPSELKAELIPPSFNGKTYAELCPALAHGRYCAYVLRRYFACWNDYPKRTRPCVCPQLAYSRPRAALWFAAYPCCLCPLELLVPQGDGRVGWSAMHDMLPGRERYKPHDSQC